jgi:hypothetical protein
MNFIKLSIIISVIFSVGWIKISIVPEDKIVRVDGIVYKINDFPPTDPNIHAIHYSKESETILETKNGKRIDISESTLRPYIDAWRQEHNKVILDIPKITPEQPKSDYLMNLYISKAILREINQLLLEYPNDEDLKKDKEKYESIVKSNLRLSLER